MEKKTAKSIKRVVLLSLLWIFGISLIEIIYWGNRLQWDAWWAVPLGVTVGGCGITCFVKFLLSFDS